MIEEKEKMMYETMKEFEKLLIALDWYKISKYTSDMDQNKIYYLQRDRPSEVFIYPLKFIFDYNHFTITFQNHIDISTIFKGENGTNSFLWNARSYVQ